MLMQSFTRVAALVIAVNLLAACSETTDDPFRPDVTGVPIGADPVSLKWQEEARNLVSANRSSTLAAGRIYAALSMAQYQAVKNADAAPSNDGTGRSKFEARRGAVAGASARVLSFFYPAAASDLAGKINQYGAEGPGQIHPAFEQGVAIGQAAGDVLIEHVKTDGFTTPWTGTVPTGPGYWIPTSLPPAGATLGGVKPYFMTSGSQFRSAAPPAFGSAAFNTDLAEVVTLSTNRTPAQLATAQYWDSPLGTPTPIGLWNMTAADYVKSNKLDEREATRVFALVQATMFDALIGCWEAKYHYWMLRPSQANAAVSLAFPNPNFPAYPSGHSCVSSAAGRVLTHFFPQHAGELVAKVQEAGMSRIYAGIHYRFDVTAGQQLGRNVADWAIAHAQ